MKVLAFYLPQYHEIPENNQWWGKGFTEWTNVKKAKPMALNHYQPRVPLNNNYYCLLDKGNTTFHWQVDLARKYGVYGFCMYHYWFNGHLLLEKPMEKWLKDKTIHFPFCVCWANEKWTNGWVSSENRVLIDHDFSDYDDWVNHFNYLLPFFMDERYIRVDEKPLVGLYVPDLMGKYLEPFIKCWRELALENGLPGLTFFYQSVKSYMTPGFQKQLFDYGVEFQPGFTRYGPAAGEKKAGDVINDSLVKVSHFLQKHLHIYLHCKRKQAETLSYDDMWNKVLQDGPYESNMFPGAFVDWDNTCRKHESGSYFTEATPEKFEKYMTKQIQRARDIYKKEYLFLFAWNEWGECGYMEPDSKFAYGYLEALKKALEANNEFPEWEV
ncbi:MAG: glycoside hydrolase family 99-like domain-containing protein [Lachnospiraceae bacterium]|nr:glycoside hydrolase family 99-like domain-containing protein [Lachnospiraceae bacterium]